MRSFAAFCAAMLWLVAAAAWACPPAGHDAASLQALKASGFALVDANRRSILAIALVDCLASPDPALRDGIAFEGLAKWMRAGELDAATLRDLRERLHALLEAPEGDGFAHPFSALVLAEVARTDRMAPWMSAAERTAMAGHAAAYVEGVRDYRGYDDVHGWRHGVAHGADWLMQLALNPALDHEDHGRMLDAVAMQVTPFSGHAYVFGEPARLAAVVVASASSKPRSEAAWTEWFVAMPPRIGDEALAWRDQAWLARRHDLMAFLSAVYIESDNSQDAGIRALKPAALAALRAMP